MSYEDLPYEGEFSVYQWFPNGYCEHVHRFVSSERAVRTAISLATSVGGRLGTTVKVMITDGGDCSVWEWEHENGIVFPPEFLGKLKKGIDDRPWV